MKARYYIVCTQNVEKQGAVWNLQQFHSFASCSSAPSGEFCSKTRKQWIARKLRGEFPNRKVINVQKLTGNFASHNGKCKTSNRKILFDNYWQKFEELLELILAWLEMFLRDITFMVLPQPNQFDNLQCTFVCGQHEEIIFMHTLRLQRNSKGQSTKTHQINT